MTSIPRDTTPAPASEGTPAEQQLHSLEATAARKGSASYPLKDNRTIWVTMRHMRITHTMRGGKYEPVPERPQYNYKATRAGALGYAVDYLTRKQALRLLEEA